MKKQADYIIFDGYQAAQETFQIKLFAKLANSWKP